MHKYFLFLLLACPLFLLASPAGNAAPKERRATIFYTAEAHGTLEPCGCTSDPLGDFARVTALVRKAAGHGKPPAAIWVDAGNLTYPSLAAASTKLPSADLRAAFLANEIQRLPFGGSALGDSDAMGGQGNIVPKRLAANLDAAPFVEPSRLVVVGGIRIGVLGVVELEVAHKLGLSAHDPGPAAREETARLRAAGAEIVILLAPVERPFARTLARTSEADIVVVGKDVGDGMARAESVGDAFLVAPSQELQRVGRLEIVLRGKTPRQPGETILDAGGVKQTMSRIAELDHTLAQLETNLVLWEKDPGADPAFVTGKLRQRDDLRAERAHMLGKTWQPPATGAYLTNELVPIRRALPRDPALATSMHQLDRAIGAANLQQAKPPAPAEPGRASYVGGERCVSCHKPAARFWKGTVHAHAFQTLVEVGKQAHDDCIGCHVTGYGEVGGTSLGYTKDLENIQCEVCHGPGSIHVEKRGKETPFAGTLKTEETVCVRCHNEKHSDTFQYPAYMRDILGPGHGEDARDALGPGPTGKELRRAAQTRALGP